MPPSPIEVVPVRTRREERDFCTLPYRLHAGDPKWVPPLRMEERRRWLRSHNSSLRNRWATRFLALRAGKVVGRIAASIDEAFAARWEAGAGFFGFFESKNDPPVAQALVAAAQTALRERGMRSILGPVNLTTHDEVGLLVDGFDIAPTVLTPHNPKQYAALIESCGFVPRVDYHAYLWLPAQPLHPAVQRLVQSALRRSGAAGRVTVRAIEPKRWDAEMRILHELYDAAFADLWGFVPLSPDEFRERAENVRRFYRPELALIAEHDGRAAGFGLVLPDINEALAPLRGRLLPLGWLRLARGVARIRSGRFILMGVRREYTGIGVAPLIAAKMVEEGTRLGLTRVEIFLVQAENLRTRRVIEAFGCRQTKTVRLYGKSL